MATQLILNAVADACAVGETSPSSSDIERREQRAPIEWTELLLGTRKSVAIMPAGTQATPKTHTLPRRVQSHPQRTQAYG